MALSEPIAVRVAGSGGQGSVLAGRILAQAAVFDGKYVVQTQLYGAQVRGGISHCDVLIDDGWIDFPEATQFDVMYLMHPDVVKAYYKLLRVNGVVLLDYTYLQNVPQKLLTLTKKVIALPLERIAIDKFKTPIVSNMIGLGALVKATRLVSIESLRKAVEETVSERYVKMNIEAIEYGYESVTKEYRIRSEQKVRTLGFE